MQSYSPIVSDRSGEFRAAGIVGAAKTNAQANVQLGQDIGKALISVGSAFGEAGELAEQGDAAYEALGAIGEMYPGMKGTHGALGKMDPRTRRMAATSILGNLGAVSQLGIAGMNRQARSEALGLTAGMPAIKRYNDNQKTIIGQGGPGMPMTGLPQASMFGGGG